MPARLQQKSRRHPCSCGPASELGGNLLFTPIVMLGESAESFCSRWGERPREPDLCNDLGFGGLSILTNRVLDAMVLGLRLAGTLAPPFYAPAYLP